MTDFDLSNPSPNSSVLGNPPDVALNYKIDGDLGTPVVVTYTIAANNAFTFSDGTKKITNAQIQLENPPVQVNDQVTISYDATNPPAQTYFFITIKAVNTSNSDSITRTYTVKLS